MRLVLCIRNLLNITSEERNNLRYCQNICDAFDILEQCMY